MIYLNASPHGITDGTGVKCDPNRRGSKIIIIRYQGFSLNSLANLLESQDNNYLVSCVEPDDACMAKLVAAEPDVLLIQNGVLKEPIEQFTHGILEKYPDIRLLIFGNDMGDDWLYHLVRSGVHGYVNERMSGGHIRHALESVIAGKTWIERHIMERFISTQHDLDEVIESQFYTRIEQLCINLTKRETSILCEVVMGLTIKQIAEEVHLSPQGVKMHLARLFKKFKVTNRNQLIVAAIDATSPVKDMFVLLRNGLTRHMDQSS